MNFDEVRLIGDDEDTLGYIEGIVESGEQEDAFYVLDIGKVVERHRNWIAKIPRVEPHYAKREPPMKTLEHLKKIVYFLPAVKCNPDRTVIKTLAVLGVGFDCASKQEMIDVLAAGVSGERIIFAQTMKLPSHLEYARIVGVRNLTVDSEEELYKVRDLHPKANVIIRFRCDATMAVVHLSDKSGCDADRDAPRLIGLAKKLGLNLRGFSFHVGSQCGEAMAYHRGIRLAMGLIELAESQGFPDAGLIDIGGGFPGDNDLLFDEFAKTINEALKEVGPSVRVISEPGTYYVASAFTLACFVFGKKIVDHGDETKYMYYINDGVCGSFMDHALIRELRFPILLKQPASKKKRLSTIWGPTLDPLDCVIRDYLFPECEIGDWLVFKDMGDYTLSLAGTFNGFLPPVVFPFSKKSILNSVSFERGIVGKDVTHIEGKINERPETFEARR